MVNLVFRKIIINSDLFIINLNLIIGKCFTGFIEFICFIGFIGFVGFIGGFVGFIVMVGEIITIIRNYADYLNLLILNYYYFTAEIYHNLPT